MWCSSKFPEFSNCSFTFSTYNGLFYSSFAFNFTKKKMISHHFIGVWLVLHLRSMRKSVQGTKCTFLFYLNWKVSDETQHDKSVTIGVLSRWCQSLVCPMWYSFLIIIGNKKEEWRTTYVGPKNDSLLKIIKNDYEVKYKP